jgi:hypothetical protein
MEASRPMIALESQDVVVGAVEGRLVVGSWDVGGSIVVGMVEGNQVHAILL